MWDDAKQLDAMAKSLALFVGGAAAVGQRSRGPRGRRAFAFREVVIRGTLDHVDAAQLESVVRHELSGTFFTMNLETRARLSAQAALGAQRRAAPAVAAAASRSAIEEHVPLAPMERRRARRHLRRGVRRANTKARLPQFAGPQERAAEIADRYREVERSARAARSRGRRGSAVRRAAGGRSRLEAPRARSRSSWAARSRSPGSNASSPCTNARLARLRAPERASSTSICDIATVSRPACRDSAKEFRRRRWAHESAGEEGRPRERGEAGPEGRA